ncbi:MAG: hypothetical protein PHU71_04405 [Candidatus Gracilibacteria bacterium]|nr:hypothetical protein [Candidatus Gracilibacteria bacterium]
MTIPETNESPEKKRLPSLEDFPRAMELLARVEKRYDDPNVEVSFQEAAEISRFLEQIYNLLTNLFHYPTAQEVINAEESLAFLNHEDISEAYVKQHGPEEKNMLGRQRFFLRKMRIPCGTIFNDLAILIRDNPNISREIANSKLDDLEKLRQEFSEAVRSSLMAQIRYAKEPKPKKNQSDRKVRAYSSRKWVLDWEVAILSVVNDDLAQYPAPSHSEESVEQLIPFLRDTVLPLVRIFLAHDENNRFKIYESLKGAIKSIDRKTLPIPEEHEFFYRRIYDIYASPIDANFSYPSNILSCKRPSEQEQAVLDMAQTLRTQASSLMPILEPGEIDALLSETDRQTLEQQIASFRSSSHALLTTMEQYRAARANANQLDEIKK